MTSEKRMIDSKGKFTLNAGDITGHIMCVENGYATVFDRFVKVVCKFSLLDAPTVDAVEVVHGRWIHEEEVIRGLSDHQYVCSVCGHIYWNARIPNFNYCPNCGAKMDGEA